VVRLLWFALLAVLGIVAWVRGRFRASRQRRLMLLCRRAGLEFAPVDPFPGTAWLPFPMFGHERSGTENVVWDRRVGPDVRVFDFWYEEQAGDPPARVRRWRTVGVVPMPFACPPLRITPREPFDALDGVLGHEIRLELEAFDRRFHVEAEDRRFAVAFLDQRMMQTLLALPERISIELGEDVMLLLADELPPGEVLLLLQTAIALRERVPRVVSSLFPPRPMRGPHESRWLQGAWSADATGDAPEVHGTLG
jgi:hypothetical protein